MSDANHEQIMSNKQFEAFPQEMIEKIQCLPSDSFEEDKDRTFKPFNHALVCYGVDAVIHQCLACVLEENRGSLDRILSLTKHYGVIQGPTNSQSNPFRVSIAPFEERGLYIPPQRKRSVFWDHDFVPLFSVDNQNRMGSYSWKNVQEAYSLTRREWSIDDLQEKSILKQWKQFASDLWSTCIEEYQRDKGGAALIMENGVVTRRAPPLPKDAVKACDQLISYYSKIINEISHTQ